MTQEALKLALDALKESKTNNDTMEFHDRKNKAIIAIKEALAQTQEPWCMKMNGCKTKCEDCPDEPPQRTEQLKACVYCGQLVAKEKK
jgi:hypothetical protein